MPSYGLTEEDISRLQAKNGRSAAIKPVKPVQVNAKASMQQLGRLKTGAMIPIKPLSVNEAWRGRRFKTSAYKNYEMILQQMLPDGLIIPEGPLSIHIEFGFSSRGSDWDNGLKPFQDILQKKYGFNDSRIYRASVEKRITKKKSEYIRFEIKGMSEID